MTVATEFYNWQHHQPEDDPQYNRCSPNLVNLRWECQRRWSLQDLGCYAERDIRAGTTPSSHSHGAANDLNYKLVGRALALQEIIPFLVDHSQELHIQAIHDYFGCRIWRAGRDDGSDGWRAQAVSPATGMGQAWALYFHIETNKSGWGDSKPITERFPPAPIVKPTPIPPPGGPFVHTTIKKGSVNADVYGCQVLLRFRAGQKDIVCDGNFGAQTDAGVKNLQKFCGLTVDGVVGPQTWTILDGLANS